MSNHHRVQAGERLSEIAALHGVPYQDIVAANPGRPLTRLQSGEVVFAALAEGDDIAVPPSYLGEPVAGPASVGAVRGGGQLVLKGCAAGSVSLSSVNGTYCQPIPAVPGDPNASIYVLTRPNSVELPGFKMLVAYSPGVFQQMSAQLGGWGCRGEGRTPTKNMLGWDGSWSPNALVSPTDKLQHVAGPNRTLSFSALGPGCWIAKPAAPSSFQTSALRTAGARMHPGRIGLGEARSATVLLLRGYPLTGVQRVRAPKEPDPFGDDHSKALPRRGNKYAGRMRLQIVPDRTAASLTGFVQANVAPGAFITTDDWSGYDGLSKMGYSHRAVAERGDPKVAEEWLPLIHLVFSNLKTWINGVHHGVSPKHLQAYLNEYTFRFNRRFYPFNAFRSLLGLAGDTASPTYDQLYRGEWRHPNPMRGAA